VCQLAFVVLLARRYPISVVGSYGVGLAYYALFAAFTGAGFAPIIYRETAADPVEGERLFRLVVAWKLRLSGFLLLGAIPVMLISGGSRATFVLVVLGGCTNYASDPALSYLSGRLRFGIVGIVGVAQRSMPLVMLLGLHAWHSPLLPAISYFVGASSTSLYIIRVAGLRRRRLVFDGGAVRQVLRLSWPLAAASLGDAVALRITTLFLGLFRGATVTGSYTPIASVASGAGSLASAAFQPLIAVLGDRDLVSVSARFIRATAALFVALLVGAAFGQAILGGGYHVVFGVQPIGRVLPALRLLVLGLVPWIMSTWFMIYMQVLRDYRAALWPSLAGTGVLVVVGVPAIIIYGIVGAAATSLLADTVRMALGVHWFLRRARGAGPTGSR
jgi:O-antigen/teichoic acid export membrane protein